MSVKLRPGGKVDARWWLYERPEGTEDSKSVSKIHEQVLPVVKMLRDRQRLRRTYDLHHARIYGNMRFSGFTVGSHAALDGVEDDRITYNICENLIGAVVSRITKNKPRATVATEGKDWGKRKRAQLLEAYIEAQFHKTKLRERVVDAFRNACIYGTGCLKLYTVTDKICTENVPPWLLVVDDTECLATEPRNLYEKRYVDREVLKEAFASDDEELAQLIEDCQASKDDDDNDPTMDSTADQVSVTEAWHLPSGPSAPGRHVICINNATLLDEPWERETFPFIFIRWTKAPTGFWGIGLIAKLVGLQAEINKLLRQIQQSHHLCAWPRVYIPRGAKVIKQHMNNMIGAMIEFDGGQPPIQGAFPVLPQEVYNHLQFLIKSAYEISGISQMTATAAKPAGVDSGIALMNLQDVQSDRFTEIGHAWEQLHLDAAQHVVALSEDLAKHNKDFAVTAVGDEEMSMINWHDACMELDQYALQVFPTSLLPHTPVGRLQFVDFLSRTLQLSPDEVYQLVDMPDVKAFRKRHLAGKDVIHKTLDTMYEGGDFISPEPFDDLEYALKSAGELYDMARLHENTPESVLENLRRYMKACYALLNPPPPPPPPVDESAPQPAPTGPNALPPMPPQVDTMAAMAAPPLDPNLVPPPPVDPNMVAQ